MQLNSTSNCCGAGLIHGLGSAHFETTYSNFKDFATRLFAVCGIAARGSTGRYPFYYAFSNGNQYREREWLTKLGFSDIKITGVHFHSITGAQLGKYYATNFTEEIKAEEERKKKLAEEREKARLAAIQRKAEEKEKKRLERIAAGITHRKPGEFRVGDTVYRWMRGGTLTHTWGNGWNRNTNVRYNGVVVEVCENGDIVIERKDNKQHYRLRPKVSNGSGTFNIQRKERHSGWW